MMLWQKLCGRAASAATSACRRGRGRGQGRGASTLSSSSALRSRGMSPQAAVDHLGGAATANAPFIEAVRASGNEVEVEWSDGKSSIFNTVWLLDNAQQLRDPGTTQKVAHATDLDWVLPGGEFVRVKSLAGWGWGGKFYRLLTLARSTSTPPLLRRLCSSPRSRGEHLCPPSRRWDQGPVGHRQQRRRARPRPRGWDRIRCRLFVQELHLFRRVGGRGAGGEGKVGEAKKRAGEASGRMTYSPIPFRPTERSMCRRRKGDRSDGLCRSLALCGWRQQQRQQQQ